MFTVKNAICGIFGLLLVLAVIGGIWAFSGESRHSRELTRAEMAELFGRLGNPFCTGCYLDTIGAACNYLDPCACVDKGGTCAFFSYYYSGLTSVKRGRTIPKTGETANTMSILTSLTTCYTPYDCVAGMVQTDMECDLVVTGYCYTNFGVYCQPCSANDTVYPPSNIQTDSCVTCN